MCAIHYNTCCEAIKMKRKISCILILVASLFLVSCNKNKTVPLKEEDYVRILQAYDYHLKSEDYSSEAKGTANASVVTQNIISKKSRKNDEIDYYSATYGKALFIEINRFLEAKGTFDNLNIKVGNANKELKPNYDNLSVNEDLNNEEFNNEYAAGINGLNYHLTRNTIISGSKQADNEFVIILDNEKSIKDYKKNIIAMNPKEADINSIKFEKIILTIEFDNNNRFKSINYQEEYFIHVTELGNLGKQTVKTNITESFNYN